MRKVSVGAADFAVLQAEELVIASYSKNVGDILLAYQIRQHTRGNNIEISVVCNFNNFQHIFVQSFSFKFLVYFLY